MFGGIYLNSALQGTSVYVSVRGTIRQIADHVRLEELRSHMHEMGDVTENPKNPFLVPFTSLYTRALNTTRCYRPGSSIA